MGIDPGVWDWKKDRLAGEIHIWKREPNRSIAVSKCGRHVPDEDLENPSEHRSPRDVVCKKCEALGWPLEKK